MRPRLGRCGRPRSRDPLQLAASPPAGTGHSGLASSHLEVFRLDVVRLAVLGAGLVRLDLAFERVGLRAAPLVAVRRLLDRALLGQLEPLSLPLAGLPRRAMALVGVVLRAWPAD